MDNCHRHLQSCPNRCPLDQGSHAMGMNPQEKKLITVRLSHEKKMLTNLFGTPSLSESVSHASPMPSWSLSSCPLLGVFGQLS